VSKCPLLQLRITRRIITISDRCRPADAHNLVTCTSRTLCFAGSGNSSCLRAQISYDEAVVLSHLLVQNTIRLATCRACGQSDWWIDSAHEICLSLISNHLTQYLFLTLLLIPFATPSNKSHLSYYYYLYSTIRLTGTQGWPLAWLKSIKG